MNSILSKSIQTLLLVVAGLLLIFAQSAFWITHTIYNQQAFTQAVVPVLSSETSRQALATAIVDQALTDRPLIKNTIGDRATSFIAGLLGSDLGSPALSQLVNRSYAYLTTPDRQDVVYNLQAIKTPLSGIIAFAESRGQSIDFNPDTIPDEIVLIRSHQLPNFASFAVLFQWLSPLFWFGSLVCFAAYFYLTRQRYVRSVYIAGTVVIIVGILGLLTGPYLPPSLAIMIPIVSLRVVVEDLSRTLLQPFIAQMLLMVIVAALGLLIFNQRFNILTLFQWAGQTIKPKSAHNK